jgi:hypothetical protein
MAGTIQSLAGVFDANTRDLVGRAQVLALAVYGASKKNRETDPNKRKRIVTAQNQVAQTPDFVIACRTTAAETFNTIELIARGVSFPAPTGAGATLQYFSRVLTVDAYVSGDATDEQGFLRATGYIVGAATPIVRVVTVQGPSAVAAAGLAATPAVTFVAGAGTLNVAVTSAEAEILNWIVQVRVGRLQAVLGGV